LLDNDGDSGIGYSMVHMRGKIFFYKEEGTDDSKLSKDDPHLFKSDAADAFNCGSIVA
jgi:hypothetical protein